MIPAYETAVRAWVVPPKRQRRRRWDVPWRSIGIGRRVLVFDTETTTDSTQRLLYGMFRVYEDGILQREGCFVSDAIPRVETAVVGDFCAHENVPLYSREQFVDEILYPEVYVRGTVLVAYNSPFDISRTAISAGVGRGKNRRAFRFKLSRNPRHPDILVEAISGRAAFIKFATKKFLAVWEKPYFRGRFLDLSTLATSLTARRFTLAGAALAFGTEHRKSHTGDLGKITMDSLAYCRNDVLVTSELYDKLRDEYMAYPFATMANEREMPAHAVPMTRLYSTASVAKATLRMIGFPPLMDGDIA